MYQVFLVTTGLLVGFSMLRYIEMVRGARIAASTRARADDMLLNYTQRLQAHVRWVHSYLNRDTVVKILHMGTYLVLMLVRILERKLTNTSRLLRSIRKRQQVHPTTTPLEQVERGVDPS